jgi:hypothetical protein
VLSSRTHWFELSDTSIPQCIGFLTFTVVTLIGKGVKNLSLNLGLNCDKNFLCQLQLRLHSVRRFDKVDSNTISFLFLPTVLSIAKQTEIFHSGPLKNGSYESYSCKSDILVKPSVKQFDGRISAHVTPLV